MILFLDLVFYFKIQRNEKLGKVTGAMPVCRCRSPVPEKFRTSEKTGFQDRDPESLEIPGPDPGRALVFIIRAIYHSITAREQ